MAHARPQKKAEKDTEYRWEATRHDDVLA